MMVLTRFMLLVHSLEGSCFDLVQVNEFWCLSSSLEPSGLAWSDQPSDMQPMVFGFWIRKTIDVRVIA